MRVEAEAEDITAALAVPVEKDATTALDVADEEDATAAADTEATRRSSEGPRRPAPARLDASCGLLIQQLEQ